MYVVKPPYRQIRATYDAETITVYQAYSRVIADAATEARTFVPPFKIDRMTWIKPSFLWMMYRSGWATKEGQERVLAIRIARHGFENALRRSSLSHFDPEIYADRDAWMAATRVSPVRIQWDPERDFDLAPLPWRSIQIGLSGEAVKQYINEWIVDIEDVTGIAHALAEHRQVKDLPRERPYPLPADLAARIGASTE